MLRTACWDSAPCLQDKLRLDLEHKWIKPILKLNCKRPTLIAADTDAQTTVNTDAQIAEAEAEARMSKARPKIK